MVSNVFLSIVSYNNLRSVFKCIKKSYKNRRILLKYKLLLNVNLLSIYYKLVNDKYSFNKYHIFLIKEPKYRLIMSEGLEDKIVNQLFSRFILIPYLSNSLIDCNVATREDMGSNRAYNYIISYFNKLVYKKKEIYALKIDISKYFYNIDHNLLLNKVKKKISDEYVVSFCKKILDTTNESYVNDKIDSIISEEKKKISLLNISNKDKEKKFNELDKLPRYKKGKGLPIGNLSSQILAIFYLNDLDHFIKEKLHCKYYVRYMDDLIILSTDKEYLKKCLSLISERVKDELLCVNSKSNIFKCSIGVEFLGYRFKVRNNKLEILYRKDTLKRVKKNLNNLLKYDYDKFFLSKGSYNGYFIRCNTYLKSKYCYLNLMTYDEFERYKIIYNKDILIFDNSLYYSILFTDALFIRKLVNYNDKFLRHEYCFRRNDLSKIINILIVNNVSYEIIRDFI